MKKSSAVTLTIGFIVICAIGIYLWISARENTFQPEEREAGETETSSQLLSTKIGKDSSLMVLIPEGEFLMGNSDKDDNLYDEHPLHKVHLDAFWIDCYEVTNRVYKRFVDETGHRVPLVNAEWAKPYNWIDASYPPGKDDCPVVLVSWEDATAYAAWAGKRLPTEAEWEKAARGGLEQKPYPWGHKIKEKHANYFTTITSKNIMKPVGTFLPNLYGIYDIVGNVWEWCYDWYDATYYRVSPYKNPQGPPQGFYRVFRGGAWINREEQLRCSERARNVPDYCSYIIGFRCALSSTPQPTSSREGYLLN
jgi:iron(II)-dependent oxidoreductase